MWLISPTEFLAVHVSNFSVIGSQIIFWHPILLHIVVVLTLSHPYMLSNPYPVFWKPLAKFSLVSTLTSLSHQIRLLWMWSSIILSYTHYHLHMWSIYHTPYGIPTRSRYIFPNLFQVLNFITKLLGYK